MNWEAIGAVAELLGAIGVVATLVYLAAQIRQNTASNRNVALQTINAQDTDWLALLNQDPTLADIYLRANTDSESLTHDERVRFGVLMMQFCRIFETRLQLYRDGAIPDAIWEASARSLQHTASFLSFGRWWSVQKSVFSDDFQRLVVEALGHDGPHHDLTSGQ